MKSRRRARAEQPGPVKWRARAVAYSCEPTAPPPPSISTDTHTNTHTRPPPTSTAAAADLPVERSDAGRHQVLAGLHLTEVCGPPPLGPAQPRSQRARPRGGCSGSDLDAGRGDLGEAVAGVGQGGAGGGPNRLGGAGGGLDELAEAGGGRLLHFLLHDSGHDCAALGGGQVLPL